MAILTAAGQEPVPHPAVLHPEIAVIGRCDFQSGIGRMSFAAAEMLARSFPVCIIPTEGTAGSPETVTLPNGRLLPVCRDPARIRAAFFADVPWNGEGDAKPGLIPPGSLNYAWLVYDSDVLPPRWVELLNDRFDLVVVTSPHLLEVARRSGVTRPLACMPIPLDLAPLLAAPPPPRNPARTRFGSIGAFHPRKGAATLVEAFRIAFDGRPDVELVIHSNLAFGTVLDDLRQVAEEVPGITLSHAALTDADTLRLLRSFDVYVSCSRGEGFAIGAREALACGLPLVLSDVGGHRDLAGIPGVALVPAELSVPARYPEIENRVFGRQQAVHAPTLAAALRRALDHVRSAACARTRYDRRVAAREAGFDALATPIASLLDPAIAMFRTAPWPPRASVEDAFARRVVEVLGPRSDRLSSPRRLVCAAYDGGFFSIFNSFLSHLVWQLRDDRCHAVYPDWDIDRFLARQGDRPVVSFCYGRPGDGNLWTRLFEPLFGTSVAEMNDGAFLYRHATEPQYRHNELREPIINYAHVHRAYGTAEFARWRRQYHRVFAAHIRLRPDLRREVDAFARRHLAAPLMIAAHVRHPSHTGEQPDGAIADAAAHVARIRRLLRDRRIALDDPGWGVFLATDHDRAVAVFRAAFGDRLACFDDVRRTRETEDARYDAIPADQRGGDGHQLQHLVAADRDAWSWTMAWEVLRDAYAMARCHVLLHAVSNVATAVAVMNPAIEMVYVPPDPRSPVSGA